MDLQYIRALRTPHSERFILQRNNHDVGAVDLHYLPNKTVAGTLTLFAESGIPEQDVPAILTHIDEVLLPDASLAAGNIHFTVVIGRVLGSFSAEEKTL